MLSALYFESAPPETTTYAQLERIQQSRPALAIPLYTGHVAHGHPIIGTTLEYFDFRGLSFAEGRAMAVLGECVAGAAQNNHCERQGRFFPPRLQCPGNTSRRCGSAE